MRVYTSNFAKAKGIEHYSISVSKPVWDNSVDTIDILAPEWEWVSMWNDVKDLDDSDPRKIEVQNIYTQKYLKKLEKLGIDKIMSVLHNNIVLCCWCSANAFCHRQILAAFLRSYNIEVKEI